MQQLAARNTSLSPPRPPCPHPTSTGQDYPAVAASQKTSAGTPIEETWTPHGTFLPHNSSHEIDNSADRLGCLHTMACSAGQRSLELHQKGACR